MSDSKSPVAVPPAPPLIPTPSRGEYLTPKEIAVAYSTTENTVNRWLTLGINVWRDGQKRRVRLGGRKIGGRWKVSQEAMGEFLTASGYNREGDDTPVVPSEGERRRRVEACMKRLAEAGLL